MILTHNVMAGTPAANMKKIWDTIQEYYSDNSTATQYTNLSISSFTTEDKALKKFPCLSGKGAEAKD